MPNRQSATKEKFRIKYGEPMKYTVFIHNDDFTTMDFVVGILMNIFFKNELEATELMLRVHNQGKAPVGTYSFDIAKSKSDKATRLARENGYPLRLTIEPELLPF